MISVAIVAIPEAFSYSIMGPLDVLRSVGPMMQVIAGEDLEAEFEVHIVSVDGQPLHCFNGVQIIPDAAMTMDKQYDLIWLPSLIVGPNGLFDTHRSVQQWLSRQYRQGAQLASVCTGAFLLAEAGLLDYKKATTHWAFADLFRSRFPRVELLPHLSIVDNDDIVCAAGGSAWHDMVMSILERYVGKRGAVQAGKMFLLQYHHNGQRHLDNLTTAQKKNDALMEKAERWLVSHLSEEDLIARTAASVGLNVNTFKKRFKKAYDYSPQHYIQRLRIEKAKEALELTDQPIEEISYLVGYQDSSFFRKLFKRQTGLSPGQYRKEYRL